MTDPASPDVTARRVVLSDGAPDADPDTTLVVGFDRDAVSAAALAQAAQLAARLGAFLAVVHTITLNDYPIDPDTPDWEDQARVTLAAERQHVEQALVRHAFGWSYEAVHGDPVANLIRAAADHGALMIIVGRHGSGISEGLHRLIDGSVSRRLIKAGGFPVLVVPRED